MDEKTEFDAMEERDDDTIEDCDQSGQESEMHDDMIKEIRALRKENEQLRTEIKEQFRAQNDFFVKQMISIVKWSLILYTVVIFAIAFVCSYIFR